MNEAISWGGQSVRLKTNLRGGLAQIVVVEHDNNGRTRTLAIGNGQTLAEALQNLGWLPAADDSKNAGGGQ